MLFGAYHFGCRHFGEASGAPQCAASGGEGRVRVGSEPIGSQRANVVWHRGGIFARAQSAAIRFRNGCQPEFPARKGAQAAVAFVRAYAPMNCNHGTKGGDTWPNAM